MALFSTVLPAFMMNAGIRPVGSGAAAIISSAGPIGTLLLAYVILDEQLSVAQFLGAFLVLSGIYVASKKAS